MYQYKLTEKENFLRMFEGELPEYLPKYDYFGWSGGLPRRAFEITAGQHEKHAARSAFPAGGVPAPAGKKRLPHGAAAKSTGRDRKHASSAAGL